jgi:uncharacterized damage-inducible protein DinB
LIAESRLTGIFARVNFVFAPCTGKETAMETATQSLELAALAAYVDAETERWRRWFADAPAEVLALSLGAGTDDTVGGLVKHIFAVELRYAQRLVDQPVTEYGDLPDDGVPELWRIHEMAAELRDRYLRGATADDLSRVLVFDTRRAGRMSARAHDVVVHALLHGIRHWAQIATVLRQHGHGGLWGHDWLMHAMIPVEASATGG